MRTLLPAARSVRDQLAADGQPLTRSALAHHLRVAGTSVSNSDTGSPSYQPGTRNSPTNSPASPHHRHPAPSPASANTSPRS
ncbi:MAG TPA: hypothetical protein VFG35_19520 [Actinoplanes sp.]|nr:hypothetical protein [Actinoplanes sp.]